MLSKKEIEELKDELQRYSGFIEDHGSDEEFNDDDVVYLNHVLDCIDWCIGEISTEDFTSESYLNIGRLKSIVRAIESRTNKRVEGYE